MVERPQARPRTNDLDAGEGGACWPREEQESRGSRHSGITALVGVAAVAASAGTVGRSRVNARTYLGARTRGPGDMMIDGVSHAGRGRSLSSGRPGGPGGGYAKEPAATPPRLIGGQAHARCP
jgi:hypothetical protein